MTPDESFAVEWSSTAQRDLRRLPTTVATSVVEFAYGAMADSPERVGHRLRFELEGKHSASRGDYRIVYQVDRQQRVVTILAVDHRSRIYRTR